MASSKFSSGDKFKGHSSSDRILRKFTVEKENHRLIGKILKMNSSISMGNNEKEYQKARNYPGIDSKIKRSPKNIHFKVYDINMNRDRGSSPDEVFGVYLVGRGKKILLARDSLFELRKIF